MRREDIKAALIGRSLRWTCETKGYPPDIQVIRLEGVEYVTPYEGEEGYAINGGRWIMDVRTAEELVEKGCSSCKNAWTKERYELLRELTLF